MKYEKPEVEVIKFQTEDVITTSFDNTGEDNIDVEWQ